MDNAFIRLTLHDGGSQYIDSLRVIYVGKRASDPHKTIVITDSGLSISCIESPDEVVRIINGTDDQSMRRLTYSASTTLSVKEQE